MQACWSRRAREARAKLPTHFSFRGLRYTYASYVHKASGYNLRPLQKQLDYPSSLYHLCSRRCTRIARSQVRGETPCLIPRHIYVFFGDTDAEASAGRTLASALLGDAPDWFFKGVSMRSIIPTAVLILMCLSTALLVGCDTTCACQAPMRPLRPPLSFWITGTSIPRAPGWHSAPINCGNPLTLPPNPGTTSWH
jgi:hypothetical protein